MGTIWTIWNYCEHSLSILTPSVSLPHWRSPSLLTCTQTHTHKPNWKHEVHQAHTQKKGSLASVTFWKSGSRGGKKSYGFKMEINTFTSISITFPLHNQIFHYSSCQLYDHDADYGDHNRCDDGDDDCVCDYAAYRPVMSQTQFFNCSTPTVCVEFAFWGRGRGALTSL